MKVYDLNGIEKPLTWLYATYGQGVQIQPPPDGSTPLYHIVELRESEGPATFYVTVLDEHGAPLSGTPVVFYWPDAPINPDLGHLGRGVIGLTSPIGRAEFAVGRGSYYNPASQAGPHAVWISGSVSERIQGLGMLPGANHRHLDVTIQKKPQDDGTGNQPPDLQGTILLGLEVIIAILQEISAVIRTLNVLNP
ncbi:MAG: hypothetical protein ACUVWZ_13835 [Anaerolineae bacterium]